ncbi:LysR family transcriptional regulator [Planococcus plakortidis]|nr:LysR family transcriptional regulator [Planococcus plakortidis]
MEMQWLRTFADAAETLNFRKTSERLMLSQPSVTVHIRQLEEYLGIRLFDRVKNRVVLTEEGHHFKYQAGTLVKKFDSTVDELHSFAQGYRRQ